MTTRINYNQIKGAVINVLDYAANTVPGTTDMTAAIQAAINVSGRHAVYLPAGTYLVSNTITLASNVTLFGDGIGTTIIIAKSPATFENVIYALNASGFTIENLTVDGNVANRTAVLTARIICINLDTCTSGVVRNVQVQYSLGYSGISGVGFAVGGASSSITYENCRAVNCGTVAKPSDGFFMGASYSLISNCLASDCTDTGFVIESASHSGIVGCVANTCSAGAAITNAINTDTYGNYINGLTVKNWSSAVTGGIQIGHPLNTSTGVLYDTNVSNVVMVADVGGGYGLGPAINVRKTGTPQAVRVNFNGITIENATTQGILVVATQCRISGCLIVGTASSAIRFDGTSSNCFATNNQIHSDAIATSGTATAYVTSNLIIDAASYGVYASDTSTCTAQFNTIVNPGVTYTGKDAGATLDQIGVIQSRLLIANTTAAAPAGLNHKFPITTNAGTTYYVPAYDS
jgi:hypothetical protein